MLRVLLNGTEVTNSPKSLDSINEEYILDTELKGYIYQISGSIKFQGSDYDTLRALYETEYCQEVTIEIQYSLNGDSWATKVNSLVKVSDIVWDRVRREAECPIIDNSYLSKINTNKNIEFELGSNSGTVLSKNGVDVSSRFVYHDNVQMFSPFRGRYFEDEANFTSASIGTIDLRPQGRRGIFIYDALNLLIGMMSDGEVGFESTYFSYDLISPTDYNEDAFSVLIAGAQARLGTKWPTISFFDLMNDLHKLCNVWFALEVASDGSPVIRVEDEAYFRSSDSAVYFDDAKELSESVDLSKIYANVSVGCSRTSGGNFPIGDIQMMMQGQEEYGLEGTCNIDNTLDLQLKKLIISTNNICLALAPVTGYRGGGSVIRKYTTEDTTAGTGGRYQFVEDSAADFEVGNIEQGYLIHNTVENTWSYIVYVNGNTEIIISDVILTVDDPSTGLAKDYEIFKASTDTDMDKEVLLVQLDRTTSDATTAYANKTEIWTGLDLWFYNTTFSNLNVLTRHMGSTFGQTIITGLTNGNDEFNSEQDQDVPFDDTQFGTYLFVTSQDDYVRVRFKDDTTGPTYFDTNGNYDAATGIYTAPQNGYYHAECSLEVINQTADDYIQQVGIVRVSASGDALENEVEQTTILNGTSYVFTLDRTFYLNEGERLEVWIKKRFGLAGGFLNQYLPWSESGASYGTSNLDTNTFGVDLVENGGTNSNITVVENRVVKIDSEISVDRDTFDTLLQNGFKYYHIYDNHEYVTGYIERISRGIENGNTNITLFKKHSGV